MNGIKIASNIRAERNRKNITIDELTKTLNISKPTYVSYEKDASNLRLDFLIKLSILFECEITQFFL